MQADRGFSDARVSPPYGRVPRMRDISSRFHPYSRPVGIDEIDLAEAIRAHTGNARHDQGQPTVALETEGRVLVTIHDLIAHIDPSERARYIENAVRMHRLLVELALLKQQEYDRFHGPGRYNVKGALVQYIIEEERST